MCTTIDVALEAAFSVLGQRGRSGRRIADNVAVSFPAGDDFVAPDILGAERWFIWDCARMWTAFESFQRAAHDRLIEARLSGSQTQSQLEHALHVLSQLNAASFCVAVESNARDMPQGIVMMVNRCSRHGDAFGTPANEA